MRVATLAALAALAFTTGPAAGQGKVVEIIPGSGDPIPVTQAETARYVTAVLPKARDLLDRELIDYPSARFREVRASGAPLGLSATFCGFINARNRAGGFTGWEPFMLRISDGSEALYVGTEGAAPDMIKVLCLASRRVLVDGDFSDRLTYR